MFKVYISYLKNPEVPLESFDNLHDAMAYINCEIDMIREVEKDFVNDLFFVLDTKRHKYSFDGIKWEDDESPEES